MSRSSARLKERDLKEQEPKKPSTRNASAAGKAKDVSPPPKNVANKNKNDDSKPAPTRSSSRLAAQTNTRETRSKASGTGGSGKKQLPNKKGNQGGKRKSRSASPPDENQGVRRSTRTKRTVDRLTDADENKSKAAVGKRNKTKAAPKDEDKIKVSSTSTRRNPGRAGRSRQQNLQFSFDEDNDSLLDDEEEAEDDEEENEESGEEEAEGEEDNEEDKNEEKSQENAEDEDENGGVITVIQKRQKQSAGTKKNQEEESKKDTQIGEEKSNKKKIFGTNRNSVSSATRSGLVDRPPTIKILEVKVVNKGANYSIWRKLFITDEIKATQFARVIVASMGWMGYRDWEFEIHGLHIPVPPDDDDDREDETQTKRYADNVTFSEFNLQVNDKFSFSYGTDDNPWVHEITIEAVHDVDRIPKSSSEKSLSVNHAVIITGMGACPRDDEHPKEFDKAMEAYHKNSEEFEKYLERLGETYDPNIFDKDDINKHLKIYLYDTTKMDAKLQEDDKFFKY